MTRSAWKRIKTLRVVLSLFFFALFTSLFLDAWHVVPRKLEGVLASLQIVPSLLKVVMVGGTVAAIGLGVIVITTLLIGRVYCSTVCPLGVLQDIMIRIARKVNRRKRFRYSRAPQWLHYSILAISLILVLFGSSMVIGDLLEPFSNYGRMVNAFALPIVILANNSVVDVLAHFGVYFLYNIPLHLEGVGALSIGLLFLVTLAYLSASEGRLFCNTFCPAGAILNLLSRVSLYKLVIEKDICNDCGACDKVCARRAHPV